MSAHTKAQQSGSTFILISFKRLSNGRSVDAGCHCLRQENDSHLELVGKAKSISKLDLVSDPFSFLLRVRWPRYEPYRKQTSTLVSGYETVTMLPTQLDNNLVQPASVSADSSSHPRSNTLCNFSAANFSSAKKKWHKSMQKKKKKRGKERKSV